MLDSPTQICQSRENVTPQRTRRPKPNRRHQQSDKTQLPWLCMKPSCPGGLSHWALACSSYHIFTPTSSRTITSGSSRRPSRHSSQTYGFCPSAVKGRGTVPWTRSTTNWARLSESSPTMSASPTTALSLSYMDTVMAS